MMGLQDIIRNYSNKLNKFELFDLFYKLKTNIDFNSSKSIEELYKLIGSVYTDNSPLYQNYKYSLSSLVNLDDNTIDTIVFTDDKDIIYDEIECIEPMLSKAELFKVFDKIFELASSNQSKEYYLIKIKHTSLSNQEIYQYFLNKIIPNNICLPIEYVHKTYISKYFYNEIFDCYYKITDDRKYIVNVNNKYNKIEKTPYINGVKLIENIDTCIIDESIFINAINKLITNINA